jgi:hypothetical protein
LNKISSCPTGGVVYTLATGEMAAAFFYYELSAGEYPLVPREILPSRSATFVDRGGSAYQRFKNTLAALSAGTYVR